MSDKSNEKISNLMDGELEVNASQFLLKRMATDDSLSETWRNYHLIKSCLQKDAQQPLVFDVAASVCQQLQNNPRDSVQQEINEPENVLNRWLKPLIGAGIAASVAITSVFMLQNQKADSLSPQPVLNVANDIQPMKTSISANVATSGKSIVPPVSLSRFPSVNNNNTLRYNQSYSQGFSQNANMPYLMIINPNPESQSYSPIVIKDVAD